MKTTKQFINVTPLAIEKMKQMIANRNKPTRGIRIGIRTKGCSGLSYTLEFSDEQQATDQIIALDGIEIFIDPKSILFLIGTTMDFVEEEFSSGFKFTNPNEKGRCGCGESFHV